MNGKFFRSNSSRLRPPSPPHAAPAGMVKIPEADFEFQSAGIMIEGGNDVGVDVQYPWEDAPRRYHLHKMHIKSFYIDKYPVTNAEFKKFLDATHYHPHDDHNFLARLEERKLPRRLGEQAGDVGFSRGRARLRRLGRQSACRTNGNGSMPRRGPMAARYPWGNEWDAVRRSDARQAAARCASPPTWMHIPKAPARSA